MIRDLFLLGVLGLLSSGIFLYLRPEDKGSINPQPYTLPEPPKLVGPLTPNTVLQNAEYILEDKIEGPESLVVHQGFIYATLHNGEIVKIQNGKVIQTLKLTVERNCGSFEGESRCGRPLGIRRLKDEQFVVVDAYLGVYLIDFASKKTTQLINSRIPIAGKPAKFLNDLDILNDDEFVFSDSSPRWERRNVMSLILEQVPEGRVFKHKISTKETTVLLDGLYFPNGVQLLENKEELLISECTMARIKKFNLKTGKVSMFAENLPGLPDNIRADDTGRVYVGLASVRHDGKKSLLDRIGNFTNLRHFLIKVFDGRFWNFVFDYVSTKQGIVLEFNQSGKLTRSFHDPTGLKVTDVSQVVRDGNNLYLGSFRHSFIAKVVLKE